MRFAAAAAIAAALACGGAEAPPEAVQGRDLSMRVALEPAMPRVGENEIVVEVRDAAGAKVDDATVDVRVHMAAMGAMPAMGGPARVEPMGGGKYAADFELEMGGSWQVEVRATRPSGASAEAEGSLTVGVPGLRLAASGAGPASPAEGTPGGAPVVTIDPGRLQEIGVRVAAVEAGGMDVMVRAVGRVTWDETALRDVSLKVRGWVRELRVGATGARVERGEVLLLAYSPDLYAAQAEYLQALASREAARAGGAPTRSDALVEASRRRLALWDLAPADLEAIARAGAARESVPVRAPASGFVVEKSVVEGSAFEPGQRLFRIAPLDPVWVEARVYESELPLVAVGQEASIEVPQLGRGGLRARVDWIYPVVDPATRTARVRLVLPNADLALRPDMYANVELRAPRPAGVSVPESALLYAGKRRFAFVEEAPGRFRARAVETGARSGGRVEILSGLAAGERVVVSGTFLVAAESRLDTALEEW
jgi:Cu(I)/Ag(I) efflux system membrane fusion protein